MSGNISNARAKLASTKTEEINTTLTDSGDITQILESSKKVTFETKDSEADEKKVFDPKEEGNTESESHEVKQGRKAAKSISVKTKRKE